MQVKHGQRKEADAYTSDSEVLVAIERTCVTIQLGGKVGPVSRLSQYGILCQSLLLSKVLLACTSSVCDWRTR